MNKETIQNARTMMDELDPQGEPNVRFMQRANEHITQTNKRLGVLDASFNPLTLAHAALSHYAQEAFAFDEQLLLLAKANVDKDLFGADLSQRLAMMVAYAQERLSVAGCSHARFVDKAQALKTYYPPDTTIFFIMGHDTLVRLFEPRYYTDMPTELQALFSLCHIISANRADQTLEDFQAFMSTPACAPFADRVHPLSLPSDFGLISSTEVRNRIKTGKPISDLVPPAIEQAITALNLYSEQ